MINALFVLIVFLLQLNKDNLHVKWPISARINVTYDEVTQEVKFLGASRTYDRSSFCLFTKEVFIVNTAEPIFIPKFNDVTFDVPYKNIY